jgi:hypothetical protein
MKYLLSLFCLFAGFAHANTSTFDAQMKPIAEAYLAVQAQLAQDGMTDVVKHAAAIKQAVAKLDPKTVNGQHAGHFAALPEKIATAAAALEGAQDIKAAREAFKALSRPVVMWASMSKPEGISVMYCSMAKGSWLQNDTAVRNPYYGKQMLACGEIIEGAGKGAASGHMKTGH